MDIENYRGYQIALNEHNGEFRVIGLDSLKNTSLVKVRKELDVIIKETRQFTPFFVINFDPYKLSYEKVQITSIRKDGRFMCKKEDIVDQISAYDEKKYILVNDKVENAVVELVSLEADKDLIIGKIAAIKKKIAETEKTLVDFKKEL